LGNLECSSERFVRFPSSPHFWTIHHSCTEAQKEADPFALVHFLSIGTRLAAEQIADDIQTLILAHDKPVPSIVIIPSKDHAYDPSKDPELQRAKQLFSGEG
jgi:hypothetical protein